MARQYPQFSGRRGPGGTEARLHSGRDGTSASGAALADPGGHGDQPRRNSRNPRRRRAAPGRMRLEPCFVVLTHLVDVVGDVAFLQIHPAIEADSAVARVANGAVPNFLGQRDEQLIGHFAQAANNFQGFARALMKITERTSPARGAEFRRLADGRFSNVGAAAHVGAGFAIGEMQNNFVNAPALVGRFIDPHFLGKLTKRGRQQSRRATERFQFLPSCILPHRTLLLIKLRRTSLCFASRQLLDKRRKWRTCSQKSLFFRSENYGVREWEIVFVDGTRGVFAIGNAARSWENTARENRNSVI